MNLIKKIISRKSECKDLSDLGRGLPGLPVRLNEDSARSRRQALELMVKGAAFMASWPFFSREARASRFKDLVGNSETELGSLTAPEAARIIAREILHTNVPHKNIAHQNIAHTDTHKNTHINETKHVDFAPQGFEHTNTTIHTNQNIKGHINRPHQDTPHTNEPHVNVEHVNRPVQEP